MMTQIPKISLSLFDFRPRSVLIISVVWQASLVSADHHEDPPKGVYANTYESLPPFMLRSLFELPVYVVR